MCLRNAGLSTYKPARRYYMQDQQQNLVFLRLDSDKCVRDPLLHSLSSVGHDKVKSGKRIDAVV
jgi:hypothetical protein